MAGACWVVYVEGLFGVTNLLTLAKFVSSYGSGRAATGCRMVPLPRRVAATRDRPFALGNDMGVVCPRKGRGVRHGTRFLTSCLGGTANGSCTIRTNARNGNTVLLGLNVRSRGPRTCRLDIGTSNMAVTTPARTNMFCNVRALHGSVPMTVNAAPSLPTIRVDSCPHFDCHNTRFSMNHRFFAMSRMGACVSVVTLRGVGHLR